MTAPVELAHVTRNGVSESKHYGSVIVLNPDDEEVFSLGDPTAKFFTRSALKPLQLLAMHNMGLLLENDQQRAVALASHDGSHAHAEVVWSILESKNLTPDALLCPASWPFSSREARTHAAMGGGARSILHTCSGKHAAMLSTCVVNGWSLEDYTSPDHPLQQGIKEFVQRYTGETSFTAVDGCGAPTHAVSLRGLASATRRMATSSADSPFNLQRVSHDLLHAAKSNGWLVSGKGTGDTVLIDELGIFSKVGAEGSLIVADSNGFTAAVKVVDGSARAVHAIALQALQHVGVVSADAHTRAVEKLPLKVFGGAEIVGEIKASF